MTTCTTCRDVGMYGGKLPPGQYAGPWRWCKCPAAAELRDREPDAVDNANRARDQLLQLGGKQPDQVPRPKPISETAIDDGYSGEF